MPQGTFYFDNSLLHTFAECKAKGIIEHKLKRTGQEQGLYGDLGTVGHTVLDAFFSGKHNLEYCLDLFHDEYDDVIPPGMIPDKPEMGKQNMIDILEQYMIVHPIELLPFNVVALEKNITVELEPGYMFSMKRDMLVQDKQSGFYYPVDHKFRFGRVTNWWTDKFKTNSQISGYIWGTQAVGKSEGYDVADELLLNIISLAELPKSTKKCSLHKRPYNECRALHTDFQFKKITRTPEQLESWRRDVIGLAKEAEMFFETFDTLELIPYAPKTGAFSEGCTFCSLQKWCQTNFNSALVDELTVGYNWQPWDELPF